MQLLEFENSPVLLFVGKYLASGNMSVNVANMRHGYPRYDGICTENISDRLPDGHAAVKAEYAEWFSENGLGTAKEHRTEDNAVIMAMNMPLIQKFVVPAR